MSGAGHGRSPPGGAARQKCNSSQIAASTSCPEGMTSAYRGRLSAACHGRRFARNISAELAATTKQGGRRRGVAGGISMLSSR